MAYGKGLGGSQHWLGWNREQGPQSVREEGGQADTVAEELSEILRSNFDFPWGVQ